MDDTTRTPRDEGPEVIPFLREGQPLLEGSTRGPEPVGETLDSHEMRVSRATKLSDLAEDYVFFTHGLLFTHAFWQSDPVVDHIKAQYENGKECEPFHVQTPAPVFRWFEARGSQGEVLDDQWNHQLVGVPRGQWDDLFAFLCSLSGVNRSTNFFHTIVAQKIPVVDVLHLAHVTLLPDPIPQIDVICFAVASNRRTVYFAPEHRREPWGPVPVMTRNAEPQVKKLARAILADLAKPMAGAVEPTQKEAEDVLRGASVDTEKLQEGLRNPAQLPGTDEQLREQFMLDGTDSRQHVDRNLVQDPEVPKDVG